MSVSHITLKGISSVAIGGTVHPVCPSCGLVLTPYGVHPASCVMGLAYIGRHRA